MTIDCKQLVILCGHTLRANDLLVESLRSSFSCDDGDGLFVWVRAGGAFKSSKVKLWKGEKLHENPLCMLEFIVANSENLPIFAILMHESNRQRQIKSFTLVWPNEPNDWRKQVCFLKLIYELTKGY